jgi:hypothetical protein
LNDCQNDSHEKLSSPLFPPKSSTIRTHLQRQLSMDVFKNNTMLFSKTTP